MYRCSTVRASERLRLDLCVLRIRVCAYVCLWMPRGVNEWSEDTEKAREIERGGEAERRERAKRLVGREGDRKSQREAK